MNLWFNGECNGEFIPETKPDALLVDALFTNDVVESGRQLHLTRRLMSQNLEGICIIVSLFPDIARDDLAELGNVVQYKLRL